ncbi:MAG TPA: hypothetical protein VMV69_18835 [Pirellulales bacterium]|nr:hypothetical protein [Pirellulales bacterium]
MTLTIALPPETENKLRACAAASGQDITSYALQAIEEKLQARSSVPIDEILTPLRQEFRESGMPDEQLHDLLAQARDEVRRKKRGLQSP